MTQDVRTHQPIRTSLRHSSMYGTVASRWEYKTLFSGFFWPWCILLRKIRSPWLTWGRSEAPPPISPMSHSHTHKPILLPNLHCLNGDEPPLLPSPPRQRAPPLQGHPLPLPLYCPRLTGGFLSAAVKKKTGTQPPFFPSSAAEL